MEPDRAETAPEERDLRCCCGRLLAVRTAAGYEIRCGRCKSVQVLPLGPPEPPDKMVS